MRPGIIVLRDRETHDPQDGGAVVPVPALPGTWTRTPQGRTGWVYIENASGHALWWLTVVDGPDAGYATKILGAVFPVNEAHGGALKSWALTHANAWTLRELRADSGAAATAIKAAWRMYALDAGGSPTGPQILTQTIAGFSFAEDSENFDTIAEIPD